ncbi:type III PLP-dependent enzyme domain-containing protein, partial [Roseivivax sp. CAU 1761]
LWRAAARGFRTAMTFHPGTQCVDPESWARYVTACAGIARAAGVTLARLNVGGGFAAHRGGARPDLERVFAVLAESCATAFEGAPPPLVCEPGRAMVAEAYTLALRVKGVDERGVTLNDGIYGALAEWRDLGAGERLAAIDPDGQRRPGRTRPRTVFGPTCDSLDALPGPLALPEDLACGDYLLIEGMGAYAGALVTRFNGYGGHGTVTLSRD